ncbi:DUF2461 family protein [Rhodophyticola sp.]|uniref:DUF2461 family protein n=1 Tax=Rhodophyticola sp. TaxID=2680032 RepID=UPI003D291F9D
MSGFSSDGFAFLNELKASNNKEWFNAHKARYKEHLEAPFAALLEALKLAKTEKTRSKRIREVVKSTSSGNRIPQM